MLQTETTLKSLEDAMKLLAIAHYHSELSALKDKVWHARVYLDNQASVVVRDLFAD